MGTVFACTDTTRSAPEVQALLAFSLLPTSGFRLLSRFSLSKQIVDPFILD